MGRVRRALVWAALALGVGILILFALPSYRQGEASIAGKTADDFALTIDGKPQRLSDYRGKVVVLNFWASWCPPCLEEAPALNRLQRHIEPLGGTILGVSIDEDPAANDIFFTNFGFLFNHCSYANILEYQSKNTLL